MNSAHASAIRASAYGLIEPKFIQFLDKTALIQLQSHLGLGEAWGKICLPQPWLPPSSSVTTHGIIRLSKRVVAIAPGSAELELANLTVTRLVLLHLLVPMKSTTRNGSRFLAARTIALDMNDFTRLFVPLAFLSKNSSESGFFSRMRPAKFREYTETLSPKDAARMDNMTKRLRALNVQGYWDDVPSNDLVLRTESPRRFRQPPTNPPPRSIDEHEPFSDEFTAEAGWRAAWLTRNLAAALAGVAHKLTLIDKSFARESIKKDAQRANEEDYLSGLTFRDEHGRKIDKLPFEMNIGSSSGAFTWPPKCAVHVFALLEKIQAAHLFIVLLSTGGRISEILSFQSDCIALTKSTKGVATADGRTYKLVFKNGGEMRDWPLPALAIEAIRNQVAITEAIGNSDGPGPLWRNFSMNGFGNPMSRNYSNQLRNFVSALSLTHLLGKQGPRAHRFRKTIARLVALAIAEAPKVLMDIFGHKSIEMTMHYVLTDPLIRAEVEEVRRELVVMRATRAVENVATNGGPAAKPLKEAIQSIRIQHGTDWSVDNIRDLAFTLTANGDNWALVRPGVLCTKQQNQTGPCNAGKSIPDPARCRPHCIHLLQEASAADDADHCLRQAVEFIEIAVAQDDEIQRELWSGQVLAHLPRFESVRKKWEGHPIVAALTQSMST